MSIRVHLEKFEGPLALLLYLIRKDEMDIYDIEIHRITEQYLEYIKMMKELNLELAGDFVAMAATLIHIKSKMLLPNYDENGEVIQEEDPRQELVQRLLEYEKFQQVGKKLYSKPLLGREIWARGGVKALKGSVDPLIIVDERGLFALIGMYRGALKKIKKNVHVVVAKAQSIASRIIEIRDRLIPGQRAEFQQLIGAGERTKTKWVVTFLSVLELGKLGFVSLFQSETFGPIYIDTKKKIERDVVSQVEEYETRDLESTEVRAAEAALNEMIQPQMTLMDQAEEAALETEAASDEEIAALEREIEEKERSESLMGAIEQVPAAEEYQGPAPTMLGGDSPISDLEVAATDSESKMAPGHVDDSEPELKTESYVGSEAAVATSSDERPPEAEAGVESVASFQTADFVGEGTAVDTEMFHSDDSKEPEAGV